MVAQTAIQGLSPLTATPRKTPPFACGGRGPVLALALVVSDAYLTVSRRSPHDSSPGGHPGSHSGLALVEVVIAVGLLVTLTAGVAQLYALSAGALLQARHRTSAVILAIGKLEELRAVVRSEGTAGLAGFAAPHTERLDPQGQLLDSRLGAMPGARYDRVWLIDRPAGVRDVVRIQVQVAPVRPSGGRGLGAAAPPDGARVATLVWTP